MQQSSCIKTLEFFKSFIIRVSFPINFIHKSSCIQAWSSLALSLGHGAFLTMLSAAATHTSTASVQLHLMIFKRTAWAGGFLVAIRCNSNAVHVQPHSYGCRLYSESFHWSIWRNTHLLWKLAASAVRDNYFGSTWDRLLATSSQYFLYLEAFRVSPFFP